MNGYPIFDTLVDNIKYNGDKYQKNIFSFHY